MALLSRGSDRVLRKRKIPYEKTDTSGYKVLKEHNYFFDTGKKRCRWPDKENSFIDSDVDSTETELMSNNDDHDECHSSEEFPDWLKDYKSSSDESLCDEEDDYEGKSLAQILRMEYEKELANENRKNKSSNYLIPPNKRQPRLKPKFIKCYFPLHVPNNTEDCTTGVENPNKIIIPNVQILTKDATIFESRKIINYGVKKPLKSTQLKYAIQKITECVPSVPTKFQTRPCFIKCNRVKPGIEKNSTLNELLSNNSSNEKTREDLSNDSQNDLMNSSLDSTKKSDNSELFKSKKCTINDVDSIEKDTVDNMVSQLTENVGLPFDWILLIYLAIKNSSREYVTCYDVQTFSRHWFKCYSNTSWINDIRSALIRYNEKYFDCLSVTVENEVWTVNNNSVNALEAILNSVVDNFKNEIKLTMRHPDQLPILLKGYDVFNLGHKQKIHIS